MQPRHRSLYADDPFMQDLLRAFIGRLPPMVSLLRRHRAANRPDNVRAIVHQLKGSGRSYGFPHISAHARATEEALLAGVPLDAVDEHLDALIDYIENIDTYVAGI